MTIKNVIVSRSEIRDRETARHLDIIKKTAKARNFRIKGGTLDFEKAGIALLTDFRSGALGRVSLETPQSRAAMLATVPAAVAVE